ncbi:MAG: hypothetical protein ACE366_29965 [Bradymonadia bacterium]
MKAALAFLLVAAVGGALYFALRQPDNLKEKDKPAKVAQQDKPATKAPAPKIDDGPEPLAKDPGEPEMPPSAFPTINPDRPKGLDAFADIKSSGEPVTPRRPWAGLESLGLPTLSGTSIAMQHGDFAKSRPKARHLGGDPEKDWSINYEESKPMEGVSRVAYQFNRRAQGDEPFLNSVSVLLDANAVGGEPVWQEMMQKATEAGWGKHKEIFEETDRRRTFWQNEKWMGSLSVHRETGELEWIIEFRTPPADPE